MSDDNPPSEAAAAYMGLLTRELVHLSEEVRHEGGIRKVLLRFPDAPVSIIFIRQQDLEREHLEMHAGKGAHAYQEQLTIEPRCGWCNAPREHPIHL